MDDLLDSLLKNGSLNSVGQQDTAAGNSSRVGTSGNGWMAIDWTSPRTNSTNQNEAVAPSRVDIVMVRDRVIYLKRDDQLRLPASRISGNKARKMLALNNLPSHKFPRSVVSYGGPQSNAMLALAAVVHFQNQRAAYGEDDPRRHRFVYYSKKLPRFLRNQPNGNLFRAVALGMELIELSPPDYDRVFGGDWGGNVAPPPSLEPPTGDNSSLWVPQGGACEMATAGARRLAEELVSYWREHGNARPLTVCLPGGTCSTALLLHHAIRELTSASTENTELDVVVVVIPCVGDEGYARRQMMSLGAQIGLQMGHEGIPTVLAPAPADAYFGQTSRSKSSFFRFGEPDREILETFQELKDEHQVVVDLLYGAPAWTIMLRHWRSSHATEAGTEPTSPLSDDREVMYVHSGGLEGINSQLLRYKYKDLVDMDEIQLPGRPNTKNA